MFGVYAAGLLKAMCEVATLNCFACSLRSVLRSAALLEALCEVVTLQSYGFPADALYDAGHKLGIPFKLSVKGVRRAAAPAPCCPSEWLCAPPA